MTLLALQQKCRMGSIDCSKILNPVPAPPKLSYASPQENKNMVQTATQNLDNERVIQLDVELQNIFKFFNAEPAVTVGLIPRVSILGPSGCGKTTMLQPV